MTRSFQLRNYSESHLLQLSIASHQFSSVKNRIYSAPRHDTFPFAERGGFSPGFAAAFSFLLLSLTAHLRTISAEEDSRARRIGDHVARGIRAALACIRAVFARDIANRFGENSADSHGSRARGRRRTRWREMDCAGNILLVDRMTYGRARRIPPFLQIPFAFPLPRLPAEEGSWSSGS